MEKNSIMHTKGKTGILLVNLGTPDAPTRSAVYRYLKQFLSDPRVIDVWAVRNIIVPLLILPFRSGESAKGYKDLWMEEGSPLKVYGYKLSEEIQRRFGDDYVVELAMRYQNPSIESALKKMQEQRVKQIVVLPLFPQYASASTGSVQEEVMRVLSKQWLIPEVKMIDAFYDDPGYIDAFIQRGKTYNWKEYDHVLFSYHGLPERQITKGDDCGHCLKENYTCCETITDVNRLCYTAGCAATTREIVKGLDMPSDMWTQCYQSRLGRDPWVQPYTSDVIEKLAKEGKKKVLVFCPAFICDCLETTIEISDEYQEEFEEAGGEHLQLVEGLNDHPRWFQAVEDMIRKKLMDGTPNEKTDEASANLPNAF